MTSAILDQLLASPDLPQLLETATLRLAEERAKRLEFYAAISPSDKAEFINGEAIWHSPTRHEHNMTRIALARLMGIWADLNHLGCVVDEKAMVLLTRNDYMPDIGFHRAERAAAFTGKMEFYPAPALVVEVLSPSTRKFDRGVKLQDYGAHGVEEYWIIDPEKQLVEKYLLRDDQLELAEKLTHGTITSEVLSGFEIPIRALFDEQVAMEAVRTMLHQ